MMWASEMRIKLEMTCISYDCQFTLYVCVCVYVKQRVGVNKTMVGWIVVLVRVSTFWYA